MKLVIPVLLSLIIGCGVGAYGMKLYLFDMMLYDTYVRAAQKVKINLFYIEKINNNELEETVETLEHFLKSSKIILDGCEPKFCSDNKSPQINKALNSIEQYQFKHVAP